MMEQLWVIAFDKATGERKEFTCCGKNNARFYKEKYLIDGYDVKVMTDEEVDKMLESKK